MKTATKPSVKRKLIVANWKMHFTTHKASLYLHKLSEKIATHKDVEVVLAPNMLSLQSLGMQVKHRQFKLAAQNCYWRDEGAFTGEVSATMLHGLVDYVIIGHSERRYVFSETEKDIRMKVQAVLRNKMSPVLCVGETAHQRADGETLHVLHDQVVSGLANVTGEEVARMVIAYEPVWAINSSNSKTHKAATPEDFAVAEKEIRKQVASLYGKSASEAIRVIYGGSVNADNARGFLSQEGGDGLLPGTASLNSEEFLKIVESAHDNKGRDKAGK